MKEVKMTKPMKTMKMMKPMKEVMYLVVHCSATRSTQQFTVDDIDRCHRARGYAMIGYHWYITRDGEIHEGRPEKFAGAHVRHYNEHAIGVCYEGGLDAHGRPADTRTPEQKAALHVLLEDLHNTYPQAVVCGHRDFPNVRKDCPCYDARKEHQFKERIY